MAVQAAAEYDPSLAVLGFPGSPLLLEAEHAELESVPEAFIDRAYGTDGRLVPRSVPGSIITDPDEVAAASRSARCRRRRDRDRRLGHQRASPIALRPRGHRRRGRPRDGGPPALDGAGVGVFAPLRERATRANDQTAAWVSSVRCRVGSIDWRRPRRTDDRVARRPSYGPRALLVTAGWGGRPAGLASAVARWDEVVEVVPPPRPCWSWCGHRDVRSLTRSDRSTLGPLDLDVDGDHAARSSWRRVRRDLGCVSLKRPDSARTSSRCIRAAHTWCDFCGFAPGFGTSPGLTSGWCCCGATPRTAVPPGSAAIAGPYSAVYPSASPGGGTCSETPMPCCGTPGGAPTLITPGTGHVPPRPRLWASTVPE